MEDKTFSRINRISRMDTDALPIVLLELYQAHNRLYEKFEYDFVLESELKKLELKDSTYFEEELLTYLGFEASDSTAGRFIYEYCFSSDENRIVKLKKQLMERSIYLEGVEKNLFFL